ncbi:MAG: hypothetical protein IJK28_05915 [Clostridia bacterium]|nr:hypothetical protein [Clostridia bacterium]
MTVETSAPKKRIKKSVIIKRVIAAVLILGILGGLYFLGTKLWPPENNAAVEESKIRRNAYDTKTKDIKMSNEFLEFTMYPTTSHFSLKEKATGRVWMSNPQADKGGLEKDPGGVAVGTSKLNDMRSTLIVSYSSSSADKDMNNWEYSIDKQAYVIEPVENDAGQVGEVRVHYTVGQIQGIAKIPQVLTEERYQEILGRIKNSEDKNTARLDRAFTPNYENAQTISEMAQSERVELRKLAAHVLRLSITMNALDLEQYTWVKEALEELERASIVPYDRAAVEQMITEHATDLASLEGFAALALSDSEDERAQAAEMLAPMIAELGEAEENEGTGEAAGEWLASLSEMITLPNVDPVDLEALAAVIDAHGDFFDNDADRIEAVKGLILSEDHAEKTEAFEQIRDRVSDVELAKPEYAWVVELADALDASDSEDFSVASVKSLIEQDEAVPERKEILGIAFRRAKFMRAEAKENILKALKGDNKRIAGIDYTDEEYLQDAGWNFTDDEGSSIRFDVTVIYRLEGSDFVVEVPYDQITYNADAPITYITILPMFGAVGPDNGEYQDGFIFVPEGGGALIRYNNGKLKQNNYTANLYGWDYATKRSEVISETKTAFPVFGLTRDGGSFICIIEDGASYANIQADINGKAGTTTAFHPNSYNTVSAKYRVLHSDQYNVSAKTANMVIMYEKKMPQESVVQRYRFVNSDSYVDMANAYGGYLAETHPEMTAEPASEDMPVSMELVGAIDKRVVTAGLPMQRVLATTTFDQMKDIIDEMSAAGVKALNVRVSGWCNGGVTQHVLTGVHVEGAVGGDGGMKKLIAYAKDKGVALFFDGITTFAYDTKLFQGFTPRANAARFTTREIVEITPYSQIYYTEDDERTVYYVTRPEYAKNNATNLINALKDRGAYGVAFRDIGYLLNANYDPNHTTTRETVKDMNVETLKEAREKGEAVMIREGYDYAMPYADIVTDMDLAGIPYSLLDETVPFYQIAIHGSVDYTGPALNLTSDWQTELLRCAEYGAGLNFTFMHEDAKILQDTVHSHYHGSSYKDWREEAQAVITRYQSEMAGLNRTRITGHMVLPMNVRMTLYEDGTKVYVNYGSEAFALPGGGTVPARDYTVVRAGDPAAEAVAQTVFEPNGTRHYVNYTALTLLAGENAVQPNATLTLKEGADLDTLVLPAADLWINATDADITVGDVTVPARGCAQTEAGDVPVEVIILPDASRRYINRTEAAATVNGVSVPVMNWAADTAEIGEAPLAEIAVAVRCINLSDADVTFGTVTVPAGQTLTVEPEPETTAEAATVEGGDAE